ncbi:MAG: hypothetical protein IT323_12015, partial [Anaerolineae bacterium]|nr:hypothetical protein [Anaerolineae bacterium]
MAAPDPRDARLISALDECIARMVRGEPLESALARFPDLADALRPMLEAGALARRALPDAREVMAARERVRFYVQRQLREPVRRAAFPARALMSIAALILIAFAGALFLAERSLPGDALYGLKRASEDVRTALGGADFSERRIDETLALMAAGRPAEVTFRGRVAAMGDVLWAVGGVPLVINSDTVIAPGIMANDLVDVRARVMESRQALALEIRLVEKAALPVPTPTVTFTPSPSPTWTQTSTATHTATSTPTATPSATASP